MGNTDASGTADRIFGAIRGALARYSGDIFVRVAVVILLSLILINDVDIAVLVAVDRIDAKAGFGVTELAAPAILNVGTIGMFAVAQLIVANRAGRAEVRCVAIADMRRTFATFLGLVAGLVGPAVEVGGAVRVQPYTMILLEAEIIVRAILVCGA